MWIVIDGAAGSGKTWLQTKLIYKEWQQNERIYANYDLNFSDDNERVKRFYTLDECYNLTHGVIAFDEIQDLAGHWFNMPVPFRSKIAHHRHHRLTVFSNTQDFKDLHIEIRRNVHVRYRCTSLFRFPEKDSVKPILQVIKVIKKMKSISSTADEPRFIQVGRSHIYFISKYWTKEYYDTHADIDFERFVCKMIIQKRALKSPTAIMKIIDRELIAKGKKRL